MTRHPLTVVAVSVAAILTMAAPALAGSTPDPVGGEVAQGQVAGLKYVSETLVVGSSGHMMPPYEQAQVSCGSHSSPWHPTAGGVKVQGTAATNTIQSLRPMDLDDVFETPPNTKPDDWWDSTVKSVIGRSMTGYVICSKTSFGYVTVTAADSSSTDRTATATCPAGRHLVGGGGFIATADSRIAASYPVDGRTWKVGLFDSASGLGGMQVYAVCRKAADVLRVSHRVSHIVSGGSATATVMCPPARHVIGGGGRMSGPINQASLAASLPVDGTDRDRIPDDGWRVVGFNDLTDGKSLTAYALCVLRG